MRTVAYTHLVCLYFGEYIPSVQAIGRDLVGWKATSVTVQQMDKIGRQIRRTIEAQQVGSRPDSFDLCSRSSRELEVKCQDAFHVVLPRKYLGISKTFAGWLRELFFEIFSNLVGHRKPHTQFHIWVRCRTAYTT